MGNMNVWFRSIIAITVAGIMAAADNVAILLLLLVVCLVGISVRMDE